MKKPSPEEFQKLIANGDVDILQKCSIEFPLSTRLALLDRAIKTKAVAPPSAGYPPKIFVSYRWENEDLKQRAHDVAEYVRSKGYDVCLDQDTLAEHAILGDIVEYVSNIAAASIFLIVATPGYIQTISGYRDGWVYDEYKYAMSLASVGKLEFLAVEAAGAIPQRSPSHPTSLKAKARELSDRDYAFEQFVDFSVCFPTRRPQIEMDGDLSAMDYLFDDITVYLSSDQSNDLQATLQQVDLYLSEKNYDGVLDIIRKRRDFASFPELKYRWMLCEFQMGDYERAAEFGQELSTIRFLDFGLLVRVIEVFRNADRLKYALKLTLAFMRSITLGRRDSEDLAIFNSPEFCTRYYSPNPELVRDAYRKWAHWTIGKILYARGALRAANNHIKAAYQCTLESDEPDSIKSATLFGFGQLCLHNGHLVSSRKYLREALSSRGSDNNEYCINLVTSHNLLVTV